MNNLKRLINAMIDTICVSSVGFIVCIGISLIFKLLNIEILKLFIGIIIITTVIYFYRKEK